MREKLNPIPKKFVLSSNLEKPYKLTYYHSPLKTHFTNRANFPVQPEIKTLVRQFCGKILFCVTLSLIVITAQLLQLVTLQTVRADQQTAGENTFTTVSTSSAIPLTSQPFFQTGVSNAAGLRGVQSRGLNLGAQPGLNLPAQPFKVDTSSTNTDPHLPAGVKIPGEPNKPIVTISVPLPIVNGQLQVNGPSIIPGIPNNNYPLGSLSGTFTIPGCGVSLSGGFGFTPNGITPNLLRVIPPPVQVQVTKNTSVELKFPNLVYDPNNAHWGLAEPGVLSVRIGLDKNLSATVQIKVDPNTHVVTLVGSNELKLPNGTIHLDLDYNASTGEYKLEAKLKLSL